MFASTHKSCLAIEEDKTEGVKESPSKKSVKSDKPHSDNFSASPHVPVRLKTTPIPGIKLTYSSVH